MSFLLKRLPIRPRFTNVITRLSSGTYREILKFSEEVQQANLEKKPIVALESTIITHGMPYPENLRTAVEVENIVRDRGAVPATIAILEGQLTVGLTEDKLHHLAQAKGVIKTSRRDMAYVVASKLDGGTTVAGTLVAAQLSDIPIFVTGGIGGVHREGEKSMDVSADLPELGRSDTLLVCSGAKSILDISRTLEYLETQGVCVCSYGESEEFPAFYTRKSGHRAPYRLPDAARAARLLHTSRTLRLRSGILVAVPVPDEYAMDEAIVEGAINNALEEARQRDISGKHVTPFLLDAVAKATAGASLQTNIAIIKNNAKVGADIAVEFNKIRGPNDSAKVGRVNTTGFSNEFTRKFHTSSRNHNMENNFQRGAFNKIDLTRTGPIVVIGGANIDRTYRLTEDRIKLDGSTHACTSSECGGGVARNMAEALWRLQGAGKVRLLTAIGDDAAGDYINNIAPGLILEGSRIMGGRTACYAAILDARGECVLGLGDMDIHQHITTQMVDKNKELIREAPLVVLDGNAPQITIEHVLHLCQESRTPVFFEPTDKRKAMKPFLKRNIIAYASPNISELRAMASLLINSSEVTAQHDSNIVINEVLELCRTVSEYVNFLVITLNSVGVITVRNKMNHYFRAQSVYNVRIYPVFPIDAIKSVSGAGDCFSSGFIHGMFCNLNEEQCIAIGFEAAEAALRSFKTVPHDLKASDMPKGAEYKQLL